MEHRKSRFAGTRENADFFSGTRERVPPRKASALAILSGCTGRSESLMVSQVFCRALAHLTSNFYSVFCFFFVLFCFFVVFFFFF